MSTSEPIANAWIDEAFHRLCDEFPQCMKAHRDFSLTFSDGSIKMVRAVVLEDLQRNVKHAAIVTESVGGECMRFPEIVRAELESAQSNVHVIMTVPYDKHSEFDNRALAFSGQVYVYTTAVEDVGLLRSSLEGDQMRMALRDDEYRKAKEAHSKPDVFICHDSRDKDVFVRPLAESLQRQFVKVWYDEFSLSIGDSIIEKLDEGLHSCRFAMIVVSPNLLSRKKWPYCEFKSLTSREIEGGRKILLPIWLNVTRTDVAAYSLDLADKYALNASIGYEKLVHAIKAEVTKRDDS